MGKFRRIGLLTGGGDCPGLNAVIRAVTKDAIYRGIEVLGIEDGFLGLIENRMRLLDYDEVSGILDIGGTILGSTNRANPCRFATGKDDRGAVIWSDVTDRCVEHVAERGIDALVTVGGDGTMACAAPFVRRGIPCIGVPKTIDNDVVGTDITFGFATAVQIATDALDRVHTTAASHGRVLVVEVMGRNAGWIALHAGVAGGADVILLPEIPFSHESIVETIRWRAGRGRNFTIICCAEGARSREGEQSVAMTVEDAPERIRLGGISLEVTAELEARAGVQARPVVLGHVQRGGSPVAADRVLATRFGCAAVECLLEGRPNVMVGMQGGRIVPVDILDVAGKTRTVPGDHPLMRAARSVNTGFGD